MWFTHTTYFTELHLIKITLNVCLNNYYFHCYRFVIINMLYSFNKNKASFESFGFWSGTALKIELERRKFESIFATTLPKKYYRFFRISSFGEVLGGLNSCPRIQMSVPTSFVNYTSDPKISKNQHVDKANIVLTTIFENRIIVVQKSKENRKHLQF